MCLLPTMDYPATASESIDTNFFEKIRLAALGDPQDLTEPLLPDDVAPPVNHARK